MRKVVFHYHLFKNAGTSLDALLKEQFPGQWVTKEFPSDAAENRRQVADWVETAGAVCFSSHTAMLPPPIVSETRVLPLIFVRHPLDRIASAYSFERKQDISKFGANLAGSTTMAGYVETRLGIQGDRQCRNFHTHRFAALFPDSSDDEEERALRAVEELPFIGVVEFFDDSVQRLQAWLLDEGLTDVDLKPVVRNASSRRSATLEERLTRIAGELGPETFAELERANESDLALYDAVTRRHRDQQDARHGIA